MNGYGRGKIRESSPADPSPQHPNTLKYPNQKMFVVSIEGYAYLVPFIENESEIFLKTIIPSRKATKKYLEVSDDS
ncbi:MAG: hypothetical protein AUJ56_04235 [Zetaproteobacteria bacterium CG1_02_49_23]|nr:MAG: hypothetical protein AUJ56_04235 [Zetaproteobacteria bacterium CG1_02_49_23]